MFNKNGNNGHGNGDGQWPRPGQRQRAQARRPQSSASTSCSGTGSRPPSARHLDSPWTPRWSPSARGAAGRSFDYLEGHAVIDQANLIFGYGGWGYELAGDVTLRQVRDGRYEDRRGDDRLRLQRPGAGHRRGRAAPHRHRRTARRRSWTRTACR